MRRLAIALSFSALGCLLCCFTPLLLLLVAGASVGAAITESGTCYREPFSLGTAAVVGSCLLFFGGRTFRVRRRTRQINAPSQKSPQRNETPIACTLASGDLEVRLAELAELSQSALAGARREDLTLHLRYLPEAEERVRRMVEKERECCAFLTFQIDSQADFLALRITAPEAAREVIQDVYAQFERARG